MADQNVLLDHVYILVDGSPHDGLMEDQVEVRLDSSLNQPDVCTIDIHDTKLKWVDEKVLKFGTKLKVSAKANNVNGDVFSGEIAEIGMQLHSGDQITKLVAFSTMHRLTRGHNSRTFVNMSDADIVNKIAQENGLTAVADSAGGPLKYVYQHNMTDLEFLYERASRVGFVLYMQDEKLYFRKPTATGSTVELKWGDTLLEFHARIDSTKQVSKATVRGWDMTNRQELKGEAANGDGQPQIGESKPGGQATESGYGMHTEFVDTDMAIPTQEQADRLAQARMDEITTTYVTASGTAKGNPSIRAGSKIKVTTIGNRFSGEYTVSQATHIFDKSQNGYTTEFQCTGHAADTILNALHKDERANLGERLAVGIVTNNDDPDKLGRIKVRFPWHAKDIESNWARVVTPGAGGDRGVQFLPEVNDEVLIGFELGDVDHPYILGGLWNGKDNLAKGQSDVVKGGKIEQRVIKSRAGHVITLDDKDGAGGVYIEDSKGNLIHLETQSNKMVVKTQGNIEIETQADVTIKATGKISLEATQEIDIKAQTGVTIDAGAGSVTVKGLMVNIN